MMTLAVTALLTATAMPARQQSRAECRFEAARSATVRTSASDLLRVVARAGSLRIEGRQGLAEVRVRGRACASTQALLDQLQVEADRTGGAVRVEVPEIENDAWRGNRYAYLDLEIEVPAGINADILDGSGDTRLIGLGDIKVTDGSGDLHIENVGSAEIRDGSGGIEIDGVEGDLFIVDGSGEIQVDRVAGKVEIEDGSGSIDVANVSGSVNIPRDGSGSIDVRQVRGDLTVARKGSGNVSFAGVRGTVDVPERDRRRRRGR